MSSLRPLHRQAAQNFDERFIRKQSDSFLSQPEQTIWVSRERTLRTQYLHLGAFLWKRYKILASYKDFCKLPTEIVIFKNVYYEMNCFSDDNFSFFQEQVLVTFHLLFDFMWI